MHPSSAIITAPAASRLIGLTVTLVILVLFTVYLLILSAFTPQSDGETFEQYLPTVHSVEEEPRLL